MVWLNRRHVVEKKVKKAEQADSKLDIQKPQKPPRTRKPAKTRKKTYTPCFIPLDRIIIYDNININILSYEICCICCMCLRFCSCSCFPAVFPCFRLSLGDERRTRSTTASGLREATNGVRSSSWAVHITKKPCIIQPSRT